MKKRGESIKAKEAVRGKWAGHGHGEYECCAGNCLFIIVSCMCEVTRSLMIAPMELAVG
jgi:hypothetical protein